MSLSGTNQSKRFVIGAGLGALLLGLLALPAGAWAYYSPSAELPPPLIRESPTTMFMYPNGVMLRNMLMIRESPTRTALPGPGPGAHVNSFFDIYLEVSTDGGGSWTDNDCDSFFDLFVEVSTGGGGGGATDYTMDATSLNLNLPIGIIRESPTRASSGHTSVTPVPGGYMIDSFFDIFTELSVDGGQTWLPSEGPPVRMEGLPEPATLSLLALGSLAVWRRRRSTP